jgi:hypothetical protein
MHGLPKIVIAGLDPAIQARSPATPVRDRGMDARVKPRHDKKARGPLPVLH